MIFVRLLSKIRKFLVFENHCTVGLIIQAIFLGYCNLIFRLGYLDMALYMYSHAFFERKDLIYLEHQNLLKNLQSFVGEGQGFKASKAEFLNRSEIEKLTL